MNSRSPLDNSRPLTDSNLDPGIDARFPLLQVVPDATFVVDTEGTIIMTNQQAEDFLGYEKGELTGRSIDLLLPERLRPMHSAFRHEYSSAPRVRPMGAGYELLALHKDGREIPVEISLGPLELQGESLVIATVRDVTERKKIEETLRRQAEDLRLKSELIDLANDAIIMRGPDNVIVSWNHGAERLYGWSSEQAVGRPIPDLLRTRVAQPGSSPNTTLLEEDRWDGELIHVRSNGEDVPVESRQIVVRGSDGAVTAILSINRDITERRRAEEENRAARAAAEAANLAKSEFLSRMSHELRTPMNAILGFGQLLGLDSLTDEQQDSVDHILRAGRHLLELINEVLDLSGIEAGHLSLSLEPVDLDALLKDGLELIRPLAAGRGVSLNVATHAQGEMLLADNQRIRQVLLNLLSNGIKYNRPGGSLSVTTEQREPGMLRVGVRDTGFGIAKEDLPRLFTPFDRLGADQTIVEGTGLGLALSKGLVEAMKGAMGVESSKGEGSLFWFDLPQAKSKGGLRNAAMAPGSIDLAGIQQKTVLYIEDNPASYQLIARLFGHLPALTLLSATHGLQGLELAKQHLPDLVLLDLHLPDVHGSEVLEQLRAYEPTRHLPVVIASADATSEQIERLRAAGADHYLTKPIAIPEFVEIIRKYLSA